MATSKVRNQAWRGLAALAVAAASCGIFDFTVNLAPQTFKLDFGQQTGTMPAIACDASAGACQNAASLNLDTSSMTGVPSQVDVSLGCDAGSGQCYALA